jgi:hypothetical protein
VYDISPLLQAFGLLQGPPPSQTGSFFARDPCSKTEHAAGLASWLSEELSCAVHKRDASGLRKCQLEDLTELVVRHHNLEKLKVSKRSGSNVGSSNVW